MKKNWIVDFIRENNAELYRRIVGAFSSGKGLDFRSISQENIVMLSPKDAFAYSGDEGDKYFKIWMNGNKIAFCTWANTLVDNRFRWDAKAAEADERRDNSSLLGNEPYVSEYLKSYSAKGKCSVVYMFPFEAFSPVKRVKTNAEEPSVGLKGFLKRVLKNI